MPLPKSNILCSWIFSFDKKYQKLWQKYKTIFPEEQLKPQNFSETTIYTWNYLWKGSGVMSLSKLNVVCDWMFNFVYKYEKMGANTKRYFLMS